MAVSCDRRPCTSVGAKIYGCEQLMSEDSKPDDVSGFLSLSSDTSSKLDLDVSKCPRAYDEPDSKQDNVVDYSN